MSGVLTALLVVAAAFATAALSAVAGFGGGVLLLPVFVAVFGPRDAVAVLTVAQLASNGSRVWFNRTEIERRLVAVFALGAVPAAAAGALLVTTAPLPAPVAERGPVGRFTWPRNISERGGEVRLHVVTRFQLGDGSDVWPPPVRRSAVSQHDAGKGGVSVRTCDDPRRQDRSAPRVCGVGQDDRDEVGGCEFGVIGQRPVGGEVSGAWPRWRAQVGVPLADPDTVIEGENSVGEGLRC